MKPTILQKKHLRTYFRKIGYGNKCPQCKLPGIISGITENLIELQCKNCTRNWWHEPETKTSKIIEKMMFTD